MISRAIEKYMQENGIKLISLCEKAGLNKQCISMALKGKRKLSIDEYEKICMALNLSVDYFFIEEQKISEKTL